MARRGAETSRSSPCVPAGSPGRGGVRRLAGALVLVALALVVLAGCGQSPEKRALNDYLDRMRPLVERGVAISERLRRIGAEIPQRQDAGVVRDLMAVASSFAGLGADLRRVRPRDADLAPVHRELVVAVDLRRRVALLLARAVRQHLQEPATRAGELVHNARLHEVAFQRKLIAVGRRRSVEIRFGTASGQPSQ
jgi:hypothetical protein